MQENYSVVGGVRLHWVEQGSGADAPFILLHGWGSSSVKWGDAIPALATQRRTIALDLPGFGRSDAPRGSYSPAWLAGSVRAFMDAEGIERAVLVGNSLGGLVGIWFAGAWPERTEALVAVAPALPNDGAQPSGKVLASVLAPLIPGAGSMVVRRYMQRPAEQVVAESLQRNLVDASRATPGMVRALEEEAARRANDPGAHRAVVASNRAMMWQLTAMRERTWAILRALKVPVLFVWGEKDGLVPVHVGRRAVEEVPGSHLVVLDDCGHNPQVEFPERFASAVLSFARALGVAP